jgi:hypothetical protein
MSDEDQIFTVTDAVINQALDVFWAYDDWERQNSRRLAEISTKYYVLAAQIRTNGDKWIDDLALAVAFYQEDFGSDEAMQLIKEKLAVLRTNIAEAQALMNPPSQASEGRGTCPP